MSQGTVHVVGAGLAGLSAAVRLVQGGRRVVVYDAAKQAGGRCRSYHDATLGLTIDNGNHLLLSGNRGALDFAELVGGRGALTEAAEARFDFADLRSGERWTLRPNAGRLPWWIFVPARRVPGSRARDYLGPVGILRARPDATIAQAMACAGPLYRRLWEPVLLAALNTEVPGASAALAAAILRETLGAGGEACRPVIATGGLSAAFVEPALAFLKGRGASVRLGTRVRSIERDGDRATGLVLADGPVEIGPDDAVIVAVPAPVAAELLPGTSVPDEHRGIVNAHFRVLPPAGFPPLLGIIGGTAEWLFAYPDRLSVTISAGDRLFETGREEIAGRVWAEVATLTGLPADPMPAWQIVKEKRATFAATPANAAKRPRPRTRWANVALAGDWTDTGLPATIEGAIRSGSVAATVLQSSNGGGPPFVTKA
ncbi:MAG: FAD-dependent oxidoreductase [Methylobacteriaceae bacterium]|nr:FAD-dependent oxidoreductase [Methylobacteriaceae bacterium]